MTLSTHGWYRYMDRPAAVFSQKHRHCLAASVFLLWLIVSAVLSWQFFFAIKRPFINAVPVVDFAKIVIDGADKRYTAVHLLDKNCACNRYSREHVEGLQQEYPQVRHQLIESVDDLARLSPSAELKELLVSTPALALFDEMGRLVYFGPHTGGVVCGEGFDFFKAAWDERSKEGGVPWVNLDGYGCYCDWSSN